MSSSASSGFQLYRRVISISNDLRSLIPVGTLNFYDLPLAKSDLGGIQCPDITESSCSEDDKDKHWKWLDIDFLVSLCGDEVHPILKDIQFLMIFRYIMATYRIIRKGPLVIAKVRIFAVPFDVEGARYLLEWRSYRPKNLQVEKNFKRIWHKFVNYLDYSSAGWEELNLTDILLIPCVVKQDQSHISQMNIESDVRHHIERWYGNEPFSFPNSAETPGGLAEKVSTAYNSIPSPDISKYYKRSKSTHAANAVPSAEEVIVDLVHNMSEGNNSIPGVKTQLYPFQIKSLSKMYERESIPEKTLIPNLIELKSPIGNKVYYFDILNTAFYLKPEVFQQPRGGILAENMGLGKTLICLSLICLTKWELSSLPDDILSVMKQEPPVKELVVDYKTGELVERYPRPVIKFPKLSELCKKLIAQKSLPWKYYIDDLPQSVINTLESSPGYFRIPLEHSEYISPFSIKRSRQSERLKYLEQELPQEGRTYKTLYFCNTTLIVVPDNLFHQWNNELKKHIEPSFLKKLFISNQFRRKVVSEHGVFTKEVYEDPFEFIKFDLVVLSNSILANQFDDRDDSPLLKVFWKRLIIDEGHSMNSKGSRAGLLCREMHAERRWAVTGTPTSGLTRLHMEEEEDEDGRSSLESSPKKKNKYVVKNNFNEKDDLVKLGNLISNFLKIEPFHSQPKLWQSTMIRPLMSNLYGSTTSLSNLLNAIVVRHSLDEVERDIKLPQLHHVSVFLKPSFHNKLAVNLFTAVLAVNAVSSERKDIDYMFHPANRQQLRRLITNLQRATFHWSGFKQEDIEALVHVCKVSLNKKTSSGQPFYNIQDTKLLQQSLNIAKMALSNPRWRTIALLHEMNYFVSLPDIFTKTFGIGVLEHKDSDIGIFGAPHMAVMQEFFYKNRFMDFNDEEKLIQKLTEVSKPFWSHYWEDSAKKNNQKFNKLDMSEDQSNNDIVQQRIKENLKSQQKAMAAANARKRRNSSSGSSPKGVKNSKHSKSSTFAKNVATTIEAEHSKSELGREDGEGLKITNEINTMYSLAKHNISYDSIKNSVILGTASAKLSYLSSKLLENQRQRIKSIVFFEFEDSAYYLTELLDLLGVNYILYATFINTSQRAENLAEFSNYSSEQNGGITLIMDLRLASHGLTIIAATKVYFISPVWSRSVEAQAIKRAHRIGQTKEVYVETLVLEDTLEEEIYNNRTKQQDNAEGEEKKKYVIDDTGMQQFVLRHRFLPMDKQEEFAPFEAPTTDETKYTNKQELDDPSALGIHEDSIKRETGTMRRSWEVYLFNQDNLGKLNAMKNQKITKEFMKDKFLQNMTNNEVTEDSEVKPVKKERTRKTVRF